MKLMELRQGIVIWTCLDPANPFVTPSLAPFAIGLVYGAMVSAGYLLHDHTLAHFCNRSSPTPTLALAPTLRVTWEHVWSPQFSMVRTEFHQSNDNFQRVFTNRLMQVRVLSRFTPTPGSPFWSTSRPRSSPPGSMSFSCATACRRSAKVTPCTRTGTMVLLCT